MTADIDSSEISALTERATSKLTQYPSEREVDSPESDNRQRRRGPTQLQLVKARGRRN